MHRVHDPLKKRALSPSVNLKFRATNAQKPRFTAPSTFSDSSLLFLPPYSPDLNPIELVFAKLKTLFRKADERSIEASWRRVGTLLDAFSPTECKNYLRHAGYAPI